MNHWTDPLQHIACADGIEDGRQYDTFADWWSRCLEGNYMVHMLRLIEYPDDRKLRLLACRFIRGTRVDTTRTVWDLLTDDRSRSAVGVLERYAEGQATDEELKAAAMEASDAAWTAAWTAARSVEWAAEWDTARVARAVARAAAMSSAWMAAREAVEVKTSKSALAQQAGIIRDMIPTTEIAPLFERYIETLHGENP